MLSAIYKKFKSVEMPEELALPGKCDRIAVDLLGGDLLTFFKELGFNKAELKSEIFSQDDSRAYFNFEVNPSDIKRILGLWFKLPEDDPSRCFTPGYALTFFCGDQLLKKASICWACDNIQIIDSEGSARFYGFNAGSKESRELLIILRALVAERI